MQSGLAPLTILLLLYLALPGQSQGLQQKAAPSYVNCSQNQAAHEVGLSGPTNRTWKGTALQLGEIKGRVTQAHDRRMPRQLRTTSCTERVPLRHSRAGPAPSASCSQMGHCAPTYFIVLNVPLAMLLQLLRSVPGSVDKEGVCYCMVHLPSNRMALQQLEQLVSTAQVLMGKYKQELSRNNHVPEMNRVLEPRNPTMLASSYEAPAFNLLRLELERALEMVTQLKAKGRVSGAEDLLYQLQGQVANPSLTVRLLADSDWHRFRALREEVDVLKGELSQCEREKEQEASRNTGPYLLPGSCAHQGLQRFSDYYWLHESYNDLVLLKNYKEYFKGYGDGSGDTVYENFMYFNAYGTRDMAKVDLPSNTLVLKRMLPGAAYNNRFSYVRVPWKDLNFAGDEKGLWVLYATEESRGNLVISSLNTSTLEVEKTWKTSQYKPNLSGAFMVCGVLYALRSLSTRQKEIFYAFDTNTGQQHYCSILLDKMLETLHGINYSPSNHRLYVYNDGYLVTYDLGFLMPGHRLPRPLAKRAAGALEPAKSLTLNRASRP
ncbi:Olfactomedin-4 [Manis pentadactyla]|nr:Olfactomedin-4 [Manis pentadactyla]